LFVSYLCWTSEIICDRLFTEMTRPVLLLALLAVIGFTNVELCTVVTDAEKSPLPDFSPDEFTVDIEVASKERQRVIQTTMYYSRPKNMIRLTMVDQKVKSDLYFYFADDEVFAFDYSFGGRGQCTVKNISSSPEAYIIGGSKSKGKIQEPLGVLRMTGLSGFPSGSQINVKKSNATMRGLSVDAYTSCQYWSLGQQHQDMTVTHYFSDNKTFTDSRPVPVAIKVEGNGVLKNQTQAMTHVYSFFNFKFSVDKNALETPEGVYCERRHAYPFPNTPNFIKFSAETIDKVEGNTHYMEEIFDVDDRFAIMTMQDAASYSSSTGMGRRTYFRDYRTGLSFDIDNIGQSCAVRNISDPTEAKLPYDFIQGGKVHQLTADQFFYKANNTYQYLGQRNIRSIPCDVYVTKANLLTEPGPKATLEWYFAQNGTKSWNDDISFYKNGNYRLPVKFQVWPSDDLTQSISVNIYHVDYAKLRYGTFDIRPCFTNSPSNYIQLVLPNGRRSVVDNNIDTFRWQAQFSIATYAQVIWWRVADLQVYYETDDVILEFELLDAPPFSGDAPEVFPTIPLSTATANIQQAVTSGMTLNAYNPTTQSFDKKLTVSKGTQLSANKLPQTSPSTGYTPAALAGLGVSMILLGGGAGGAGAWYLFK